MTRLSPIVSAGLVVLVSVAGCASSAGRPPSVSSERSVADVTGFASVPVTSESPSGPVTIRLTGLRASRLALEVSRLPSIAQSQVHCEEPQGLIYRIAFSAGLIAQPKTVVDGYRCDAAVTVTAQGKTVSWRRDATCTLLRAVRKVLRGRARATQGLSIGCGS
ncbi:MAG TPA: hypothetical protein VMA72_19900 [Streptosporangiaceae bacterium]|nr:hypothetical protein [Streptosporangiaceae bacterium]